MKIQRLTFAFGGVGEPALKVTFFLLVLVDQSYADMRVYTYIYICINSIKQHYKLHITTITQNPMYAGMLLLLISYNNVKGK